MTIPDLSLLLLSIALTLAMYLALQTFHMWLVKRHYDRALGLTAKLPPMEALPALARLDDRLRSGQFSRDMKDLSRWRYRSFFPN